METVKNRRLKYSECGKLYYIGMQTTYDFDRDVILKCIDDFTVGKYYLSGPLLGFVEKKDTENFKIMIRLTNGYC